MAQGLDDLEFWLPSEILADDDQLSDFKTNDFSYGYRNSFGFNTDLSPPVDSVVCTTETESDDDDAIADLSTKVARSTLRESMLFSNSITEGWKLSGSPQSTLCGFKPTANDNSVTVSRVLSSPDAKDGRRWDWLYGATGEVERMRRPAETAAFYSTNFYTPSFQPRPAPILQQNRDRNRASNQIPTQSLLSYQQLQASYQHYLTKNGVVEDSIWGKPRGLSVSAAPKHSGARPDYPGETGPVKERRGTGVFMPRRFDSNKPAALKHGNNVRLGQQKRSPGLSK